MSNKIIHAVNLFGKHNKHNKLCVSLSGGVDSMVLLHCLHKFQQKTQNFKTTTHFKLYAIHINYNNRETCQEEVKFVENYCDTLGIKLQVRNITDITRNSNSTRQEYEEITRNIRFDTYKTQNCPILLGHNYEDTIENLISNIASKRKYYNLKGMKSKIVERDVLILRPLLNISKLDIYEYAKEYNIEHLPDSTPKWSRRGKLRDHVIPVLEQYEPTFLKGLEELSTILSHIGTDTESVKQFCSQVRKQDCVALHHE